ncbi:hypothetical protein V6N12_037584 [Hibiscus sabdariffa]|uniref:Uncharacterized protein n=1 Tax=Hibiscus sabdariffa TaxID=183260 RepID=A0ABR2C131_9ROSI
MKISCLKERSWRGCPPKVRHRFFQFELDWLWSDVEDDDGGWRQRQRKLRFIGYQKLLYPRESLTHQHGFSLFIFGFFDAAVGYVWIPPIERLCYFSYGCGLKRSSRRRRAAKKWGLCISFLWFGVNLMDIYGFSQNHTSIFFWWWTHPGQMLGSKVSIRFESSISWPLLIAGKSCFLGSDPLHLNMIPRRGFFVFCELNGMKEADVRGRVIQSLDIVCAYYSFSLINGPMYSAQSDVVISKVAGINQNE